MLLDPLNLSVEEHAALAEYNHNQQLIESLGHSSRGSTKTTQIDPARCHGRFIRIVFEEFIKFSRTEAERSGADRVMTVLMTTHWEDGMAETPPAYWIRLLSNSGSSQSLLS